MNPGNTHLEKVECIVVQNEETNSYLIGSEQYIVDASLNLELLGDLIQAVVNDTRRSYAERNLLC